MGCFELTNENEVVQYIDGFQGSLEQQFIEAAFISGEFFLSHARTNKRFKDHTGNLKASIGYIVALNGMILKSTFGNGEGGTEGRKYAEQILMGYRDGIVLIGVAGMNYAAYVEQMKNKSVISQSVPDTERMFERLLTALK